MHSIKYLGKYISVGDSHSSDALPQDLQDFVRAAIESYEHLATLLRLHRGRNRDWSEDELVSTLGIPAPLVQAALRGLCERHLIAVTRDESVLRYRYAAAGASDALVERLGIEFAHNPARLMRLLSACAIERVRTAAIRAFADSFVLRKKDPDRG
jgi:hypothetical protein